MLFRAWVCMYDCMHFHVIFVFMIKYIEDEGYVYGVLI